MTKRRRLPVTIGSVRYSVEPNTRFVVSAHANCSVVGVVSAARDGDLVLLRTAVSVLGVVLGGHHDEKGWRVRPRSWTMPVSTGSLGEPRAKRCKHCDGNDDEDCEMQKLK